MNRNTILILGGLALLGGVGFFLYTQSQARQKQLVLDSTRQQNQLQPTANQQLIGKGIEAGANVLGGVFEKIF